MFKFSSLVVIALYMDSYGPSFQATDNLLGEMSSFNNPVEPTGRVNGNISFTGSANLSLGGQTNLNVEKSESIPVNSLDSLLNEGLQSQDSFGRWINEVITDSSGSVIDPAIEPSISSVDSVHNSYCDSTLYHHQTSAMEQIFNITDVSPAWAFSTEKTKVLSSTSTNFSQSLDLSDIIYPSYFEFIRLFFYFFLCMKGTCSLLCRLCNLLLLLGY